MFDDAIATFHAPYAQSVAFDRSPADYLAYLAALQPGISLADRVASTADALATLDLAVFVPIERHDVIATREMPRLRRRVDALLRDILVNQTWGIVVPVVEVQGTPSERADIVANCL